MSLGLGFFRFFKFGGNEAKVANGLTIDLAVHSNYLVSFRYVKVLLYSRLGIFVVHLDGKVFFFIVLGLTVFDFTVLDLTVLDLTVLDLTVLDLTDFDFSTVLDPENVSLVRTEITTNGLDFGLDFRSLKI